MAFRWGESKGFGTWKGLKYKTCSYWLRLKFPNELSDILEIILSRPGQNDPQESPGPHLMKIISSPFKKSFDYNKAFPYKINCNAAFFCIRSIRLTPPSICLHAASCDPHHNRSPIKFLSIQISVHKR